MSDKNRNQVKIPIFRDKSVKPYLVCYLTEFTLGMILYIFCDSSLRANFELISFAAYNNNVDIGIWFRFFSKF